MRSNLACCRPCNLLDSKSTKTSNSSGFKAGANNLLRILYKFTKCVVQGFESTCEKLQMLVDISDFHLDAELQGRESVSATIKARKIEQTEHDDYKYKPLASASSQ